MELTRKIKWENWRFYMFGFEIERRIGISYLIIREEKI